MPHNCNYVAPKDQPLHRLNHPCPYDSFWVQAIWPHPQPSDGYLLQIIQYCLCSPPVQQNSQTRYRGIPKPDIGARTTLIALYCKESKVGSRSIWWNPTQYARHNSFSFFVICYLICFLTAFFRIPLILKIIKKRKRKGQNNVVLSP